jgi:hypothetical protein
MTAPEDRLGVKISKALSGLPPKMEMAARSSHCFFLTLSPLNWQIHQASEAAGNRCRMWLFRRQI